MTQSCFLTRDTLSIGFVCRWLENNLPHLIIPLHRFCVHTLTTVYRTIDIDAQTAQNSAIGSSDNVTAKSDDNQSIGGVVSRQMSETKTIPDVVTGNSLPSYDSKAMTLSQSWLLAAALPTVFTRLQDRKMPAKPVQVSERGEFDVALATMASIDGAASSSKLNQCEAYHLYWGESRSYI